MPFVVDNSVVCAQFLKEQALRLQLPIATKDGALRSVAEAAGVGIVGP